MADLEAPHRGTDGLRCPSHQDEQRVHRSSRHRAGSDLDRKGVRSCLLHCRGGVGRARWNFVRAECASFCRIESNSRRERIVRKAIASVGLAAVLSMGIGTAAVADTNIVEAAQAESDDDSDNGLWGLAGLLGLAGLAGLVRRDRDRR